MSRPPGLSAIAGLFITFASSQPILFICDVDMYKPTWYTVGDTLEKIHSPVRVYLTGFDAQLRMLAV